MTQVFRVELDGIDITDNIDGCNITEEMDRVYNVAVFAVNTYGIEILDRDVDIYMGDKVFNGFVYAVDRQSQHMINVTCRTHSAKLTEPFSTREKKTENATTAQQLCDLYASEYGVSIDYQSEDFEFGGSFERDGTALQSLTLIANVTGAEIWFDGTDVIIAPNKAVSGSGGYIIEDTEITTFVDEGMSLHTGQIGIINIQNYLEDQSTTAGDNDNTINSVSNRLRVEVDETTGGATIFTSPQELIPQTDAVGIIIENKLTGMMITEDKTAYDDLSIITKAPIYEIEDVTVNGIGVTNYSHTEGIAKITFTDQVAGKVRIRYESKGQKGMVEKTITPLGVFFTADVTYKDQVAHLQGFLDPDSLATNTWNATDSDMTVTTDSGDLNPENGFSVYTTDGSPDVKLYVDGEIYPLSFVPETGYEMTKTVDVDLIPDPNVTGGYYGTVDDNVNEFILATSNGKDITFDSAEYDISGKAVGAKTDNAGYGISDTVIGLSANGVGSVSIGNVITFAGDTTRYTVTEGDFDVSNGGTISISPALTQAISATETAITVTRKAINATTDSTGYATTSTVIGLGSQGIGEIVIGDVVTFSGDPKEYTITSGDTDVSNGGSITIAGGLTTAITTAPTQIKVKGSGGVDALTFSRYYPEVKATYSTFADRYYIKTPELDGEAYLTITDSVTGEVVGYDLTTSDATNINDMQCKLNQYIPIDIISELGYNLSEVSGVQLAVTDPNESSSNYNVRADGFLMVYVTMNGNYLVNTSPITGRNSSVKLIVNVPTA